MGCMCTKGIIKTLSLYEVLRWRGRLCTVWSGAIIKRCCLVRGAVIEVVFGWSAVIKRLSLYEVLEQEVVFVWSAVIKLSSLYGVL